MAVKLVKSYLVDGTQDAAKGHVIHKTDSLLPSVPNGEVPGSKPLLGLYTLGFTHLIHFWELSRDASVFPHSIIFGILKTLAMLHSLKDCSTATSGSFPSC